MDIKRLVLMLAVIIMATPILLMGGSRTKATVPQDVTIDVSQLTPSRCTYWAPAPPWAETSASGPGKAVEGRENIMGDPLSHLLEHSGVWPLVTIHEAGAISGLFACTDSPAEGEPPCESSKCFLRGEHYIMLKMADPESLSDGCIRYNLKGLRGGLVVSTIDEKPQPFLLLSRQDGAIHTVCGLGDNRELKMRIMACPDVNGDLVIDLFGDIFATVGAMGQERGDPDWNYRADVNGDGVVDLFGDVFMVAYRFGLDCSQFDY